MARRNVSITGWLVILLIVLGGGYVISLLLEPGGRSKEFSESLIQGKADDITQFMLITPSDSIHLVKDSLWWLKDDGRSFRADSSAVATILAELYAMRPSRVQSKDSSQWRALALDSTGTQIQGFENGSKRIDLVVGKTSSEHKRLTYIRQAIQKTTSDIPITYIYEGLSGALLYPSARYFRDKTITATDTSLVQSITFSYSLDSGAWSAVPAYELLRDINGKWSIGGQGVNPAALDRFLRFSLSLSGSVFAEKESLNIPDAPLSRVQIKERNNAGYEVVGWWEESLNAWVVQSSLNPSAYFIGTENWKQIFKPRRYFFEAPD